jgi:MYXO-CTERM domain-containing protein
MLTAAAGLLASASMASASSLSFTINAVFESNQASGYVTASLVEVNSNVEMTLTSFLASGEFMSKLYLNYGNNTGAPTFPTGTTFEQLNGTFSNPVVTSNYNFFNIAGRSFDVVLDFSNSQGSRFDNTDSLKVIFVGATVEQFNNMSTGEKPLAIAAHFQGIGAMQDSGWHTGTPDYTPPPPPPPPPIIPLPAAGFMGLAGLGLIGTVRRRR